MRRLASVAVFSLAACGGGNEYVDEAVRCSAVAATVSAIAPVLGRSEWSGPMQDAGKRFLERAHYEGRKVGISEAEIDRRAQQETERIRQEVLASEKDGQVDLEIIGREMEACKDQI